MPPIIDTTTTVRGLNPASTDAVTAMVTRLTATGHDMTAWQVTRTTVTAPLTPADLMAVICGEHARLSAAGQSSRALRPVLSRIRRHHLAGGSRDVTYTVRYRVEIETAPGTWEPAVETVTSTRGAVTTGYRTDAGTRLTDVAPTRVRAASPALVATA